MRFMSVRFPVEKKWLKPYLELVTRLLAFDVYCNIVAEDKRTLTLSMNNKVVPVSKVRLQYVRSLSIDCLLTLGLDISGTLNDVFNNFSELETRLSFLQSYFKSNSLRVTKEDNNIILDNGVFTLFYLRFPFTVYDFGLYLYMFKSRLYLDTKTDYDCELIGDIYYMPDNTPICYDMIRNRYFMDALIEEYNSPEDLSVLDDNTRVVSTEMRLIVPSDYIDMRIVVGPKSKKPNKTPDNPLGRKIDI